MKVFNCTIPEVKRVELDVFHDERGYFSERFHAEKFAGFGLPTIFPQINHSLSNPRVLRGLHYQHTPPQGKLVGVLRGAIWDVAVDIRKDSPSFGQYVACELSDKNAQLLWIPPGFAHGFCVMGDEPAYIIYYVTALYNPVGEAGIAWDDPDLAIDWPITSPLLSEKDKQQPPLSALKFRI